MKKLFAIVAVMGVLSFGLTQAAMAQEDAAAPAQTEQVAATDEANAPTETVVEGGIHKEIKTKFIEGSADFMSLVAIALVLGLAFCIERIIYLSLAEVNTKKLLAAIEAALEKGCSWITLFIAMAPSLGFLGTVIGMVMAFDKIQAAGDISPTVVAGGMKVALITTIFGLVVALILQVFYNYILSKIEALTSDMEDSSISLLDMIMKYNLKYKK